LVARSPPVGAQCGAFLDSLEDSEDPPRAAERLYPQFHVAAGLSKHRLTGIGRSTIDRILAAAAPGGAINGPSMGHLEAAMITDVNQGLRATGAESLVRMAEARGFEPRMGVNPNRISSSGRGRPDRFNLDQRPWLVPREPSCTAVNCN
jgi:hypothetical protein